MLYDFYVIGYLKNFYHTKNKEFLLKNVVILLRFKNY